MLLVAPVLDVLAGIGWLSYRWDQTRWEAVRAQALRYGPSQLDALHHAKCEEASGISRRDGCLGRAAGRRGGDLGAT
ncbi:hypothetical protein [Streptomyces massasporeus]|uniref:hypothetical protein n=1 Tax=Streptomyces massasporeus TaxID=67324 RepID=UPI003F53F582